MLTDAEIRSPLTPTLRERLDPVGLDRVDAFTTADHDGDLTVVVAANYRQGAAPIDPTGAVQAEEVAIGLFRAHEHDGYVQLRLCYRGQGTRSSFRERCLAR